jgi:hypothetical protein
MDRIEHLTEETLDELVKAVDQIASGLAAREKAAA